jgi:tetratricopeptide (TPR) repeat protein
LGQQARQAIVRIWDDTDAIVGVGFLVGQRQILTCAHVVARALGLSDDAPKPQDARVPVDFPLLDRDSGKRSASIVVWSIADIYNGEDLAGLLLEHGPPADAVPATLVTRDDLWGRAFRTFGFPRGSPGGDWTTGVLRDTQAHGWLQIEDDKNTGRRVQQGYSGAPVWVEDDLHGVVGMVVAADRGNSDRVAYAIPASILANVFGTTSIAPSPYRGLLAFQAQDSTVFFGRDDVITRLVDAVLRQAFVAVVGPSGSGKSSVVFAGLVAQMQRWGGWTLCQFHPGKAPFHALAASLIPLLEPDLTAAERLLEVPKLEQVLRQGRLHEVVEELGSRLRNRRVLVVADQFEELFALCPDEDERRSFLDMLVQAIERYRDVREPALTVVLTMRADFLYQALLYRGFADALQNAIDLLGPMTREQLRLAIEEPAHTQGVTFADGLVDRILDNVGQGPGGLPLLEFALSQLWQRQEGHRLTHSAYKSVGGVRGALSQHAEEVYLGLNAREQAAVRRVIGQLVMPGDGTPDTRRVAYRSELRDEDWSIVQRLADERLVVTDRDEAAEERAQITHEALIDAWDRLREWVAADRAFMAWRERTRAYMRLWEANERDHGTLLRRALLTEAEQWCEQRPTDIDPKVLSFIGDSRAGAARELLSRAENSAARGNSDEAIASSHQALDIFHDLGDRRAEATALGWLASFHAKQFQSITLTWGDFLPWGHLKGFHAKQWHMERAAAYWEQSIAIFRELGDRQAEATHLEKLAKWHEARRWQLSRAIAYRERRVSILRQLGDRKAEIDSLNPLMADYVQRGNFTKAIAKWRQKKAASSNRNWWTNLTLHIELFLITISCATIWLLIFVGMAIWYVAVPRLIIADGLSLSDLGPLCTIGVAIALVLATDGLRRRVLLAIPVVGTALFLLGSALAGVFWDGKWSDRLTLAGAGAAALWLLWWSYRGHLFPVAQPYLRTLAGALRWFFNIILWSRKPVRKDEPDP